MMRTLLSLVLFAAPLAGCFSGDDATPAQRTLSGWWVPRSADSTAYDCGDNLPPLELQWADEWVAITIADARGDSPPAGARCSDGGFTALIVDGATDVHVTFVVTNATYTFPAMSLVVPGPIHADLDLGHVALVAAPRTSP